MSNSTFEVRQRGIKAFPEANRVDFIFEEPGAEAQRASVFFNAMDKEYKLGGKKLSVLPADRDDEGNLKNPNRLSIRWGRQIVNLGFVNKPNTKPYFYRGLDTANDAARPKSVEDLMSAMGFGG